MSGDLNEMAGDMGSFVKDSEGAMRSISSISSDLSKTLKEFNTSVSKLNNIIKKLDSGTGTIGKLINDPSIYNGVEKIVNDLSFMVEDIKKNPRDYRDLMRTLYKAKRDVDKEK